MTDKPQIIAGKDITQPLTAEQTVFTKLVAKGYSLTKAYRKAFPTAKDLANDTVRIYASKLYAKDYISKEVETTKETQARLVRLAEDRLQQILEEDNSSVRGSKVAEVAMFMFDHANGKATQRVEQHTTGVTFNINLAPEEK